MKRFNISSTHPQMLLLGILILILGPIILYYVLLRAGFPAAIVSGVVLLMAAKHLGLLAVILAPIYAFLRRRSPRIQSDDHNSANQNPADGKTR